jgi:ribA/ribD-fused uncharacterized protein
LALPKYHIDWLIDKYENGENFEFLFFWGHTSKKGNEAGPHYFSQWFPSVFAVAGITYKSAEHWMMAQKALLFEDEIMFNRIIQCDKPEEAKALGRNISYFEEETWNKERFDIVVKGNIHKFNQHPALLDFLLSTGEKILVEASPVDLIWGIGLAVDNESINDVYGRRGKNLLGFALMEVRDFFLRAGPFEYPQTNILPPWLLYPEIDNRDMFWRMGKGEDILLSFAAFYCALNEKDRDIYSICYPPAIGWKGFYHSL